VEVDELCQKRVGTVLRGKWTLERLLGVGGMAAVYVARHKIGRLDAIKIMHPELARAEQVRKRFEQEAHVLSTFGHPGAVEVRDLETTEDGAPFIVMELLEGKSLADTIRERPPTVDETLRVADEVLDVLAAAHTRGIIHRDIKPDNLFVTSSGPIKVLDFGIAQLRAGPSDLKTKTGTTLGTVAYMPPEQLKGLDIDGRADLYGVGATMFRMLVGRPPHQAGSDVELMMKVLSEPAPRLASVIDSPRADVAGIVDRALAFDRDARFPDARAMNDEVRAARKTPSPEVAAPVSPAPQDSIATVTPHHVSSAVVPSPAIVSSPTMLAAPESALLREAGPASRLPTRVVSQAESKDERAIAGVPIVWLIAAGAVLLVLGGSLVTAFAIAAFRAHEPAPPASTTAAAVTAAPATAASSAQPEEEEDEDRPPGPPGPPGPHHPPPHGPHGHKHKP
jgi:serine/threonine-protein kinase